MLYGTGEQCKLYYRSSFDKTYMSYQVSVKFNVAVIIVTLGGICDDKLW